MFKSTNKYVCISYHCFRIKQTRWCHVSQIILYKVLIWSQLFEKKWIKDLDNQMRERTLRYVPHKESEHCIFTFHQTYKMTREGNIDMLWCLLLLHHCIDDLRWSPYPWRFQTSSLNIFFISFFMLCYICLSWRRQTSEFSFVALSSRFNHNVFSICINVFLICFLFALLNLSKQKCWCHHYIIVSCHALGLK